MRKATRQQTKYHNRDLVLKIIFEHDSISRAEIARITSLTRTTVSDIVADLLTEGLVKEIGTGPSQGGKSPILLSMVEDSRYLIGLDLAHSQFCGAVVNLRGNIQKMITAPVGEHSGAEALALLFEMLDQLTSTAYRPIIGIGVGTPGLVNSHERVVINAVNLDWKDLPLGKLLQERYHLPVSVLNDSQAAAMGEYAYNHGQINNLVVINAHHGIGAGIIINGQLFQGDGGGAGEIGHIVVVPEGGLLCRCGNHGCLETISSVQALVRRAQSVAGQSNRLPASPAEINLHNIERAFFDGDPLVQQMVLDTARYMGIAISHLVGTLNIQKIVLAGDMTHFGQPWLKVIQETVSLNTLPKLAQDTQIELAKLGSNNVILGASALLSNNYSLLFQDQAEMTGVFHS